VNPWPGFKPGFKPATTPFAHDNTFLCSFSFSDGYVATRYSIFDFSFSADRRGKFLSTTTSSASAFFLSRQALLLSSNRDAGEVFFCFTRPDIARYPRCFVSSFSLFLSLFSLLFSAFLTLFRCRFSFQLGDAFAFIRYEEMLRDAKQRTTNTQTKTGNISHTKIAEKTVCRFHAVFTFKPILSLSFSIIVSLFSFSFTRISVLFIINIRKREVKTCCCR
jgi:hypothetical protein